MALAISKRGTVFAPQPIMGQIANTVPSLLNKKIIFNKNNDGFLSPSSSQKTFV